MSDRNALPRSGAAPLRLPAATGAAALGHALLLAVVLSVTMPRLKPATAPAAFALVISQPPAASLQPQLPTPAAAQPPAPPHELARLDAPAPHTPIQRRPVAHIARAKPAPCCAASPTIAQTKQPVSEAAPRAIEAAPPRPRIDDDAMLASLRARIDAAVREAAVMPEAARRQHRQGRARVGFSYVDGTVQAVKVVESSQSRVLDDAAVKAVQTARYPAPPAEIRGQHLALAVWINFEIAPAG